MELLVTREVVGKFDNSWEINRYKLGLISFCSCLCLHFFFNFHYEESRLSMNYIRAKNCMLLVFERYLFIYLMLAFDLNAFDDIILSLKTIIACDRYFFNGFPCIHSIICLRLMLIYLSLSRAFFFCEGFFRVWFLILFS